MEHEVDGVLAVHGCLLNEQGWVVDAGMLVAVPNEGLYVSHGNDEYAGVYPCGTRRTILPIAPLGVN